MTDFSLEYLSNVHAIEQLRYRYWFAIADKDVPKLVSCFAQGVHLEYGFGIEMNGVAQVEPFFEQILGDETLIRQVPRGANPLIEIDADGVNAKGRWLVEVIAMRTGQEKGTRIGVQYFESYKKIDGAWKIEHMVNDYLYFESMDLKDSPA